MDEFNIIFNITESFNKTLLILLTLKNGKSGCIIYIDNFNNENKHILEKIVHKYNKHILFMKNENEGEILISSQKVNHSIFENSITVGNILGYPISYDLNELRNYKKENKVYNFVFLINNIPKNMKKNNMLFNFLVKDKDIDLIMNKTKDMINKINHIIQNIYPNTYITYELKEFI